MCGILGLTLPEGGDPHAAARHSFFGLFALQHRGQEGAGLATADGTGARLHKDTGLVTQLLTEERLRQLPGRHAIGHTRYSTTGSSVARNAQPFLVETRHGPLGLVHNGNLTNAGELREELLDRGFPLAATSDSEVILLMLASAGGSTWEARIERTMPSWKGAYSLVVLASDGIIAVRDPWGFRPLSIGRMPNGGWMAASETCALTTLGCSEIREVEPGEIVAGETADGGKLAADEEPAVGLRDDDVDVAIHIGIEAIGRGRRLGEKGGGGSGKEGGNAKHGTCDRPEKRNE